MEAIIFIGIQGTGKSTFYKERFFHSHIRLSLDMLHTRHRETLLVQACIAAKQPFVVDNTNPTVEERARYIQPARDANFRIVGYYFQSSAADALKRNDTRTGKAKVPAKGIFGTYKRLQLPTLAEGFDVLYYVSIEENNQFTVTEWNP